MNAICSPLKDKFFPSPKDQWDLVCHLVLNKGKCSNRLDKVVILTQLLHHYILVVKLVITHENRFQTEHPADPAVKAGLIRVDVVAHLR